MLSLNYANNHRVLLRYYWQKCINIMFIKIKTIFNHYTYVRCIVLKRFKGICAIIIYHH